MYTVQKYNTGASDKFHALEISFCIITEDWIIVSFPDIFRKSSISFVNVSFADVLLILPFLSRDPYFLFCFSNGIFVS